MRQDINGWAVINRCLTKREKKQKDLAQALRITPSAITQAKHGDISLDSKQLAQLTDVLEMNEVETLDFYSSIFHARLLREDHMPRNASLREMRLRPVKSDHETQCAPSRLSLSLLEKYEPAIELMSRFLLLCGVPVCGETVRLELPESYRKQPDFAPFSELEIKLDSYPEPGDLVLLARQSGSMLLRRWAREGEGHCFRSEFGQESVYQWLPAELPGDLRWMRPVLECVSDLRI